MANWLNVNFILSLDAADRPNPNQRSDNHNIFKENEQLAEEQTEINRHVNIAPLPVKEERTLQQQAGTEHQFNLNEISKMSNQNSEAAFNIRIGYLTPESAEFAKTELRETPEVKEAAINELRTLLHGCDSIKYRDDDDFLLIFLRACHFYPESAFEKMKTTASFRKEHKALVHGLLIEQVRDKFMNNVVNVLCNCDQLGRRVLIVNCGEFWNPTIVPADDVFRMLYMVHLAAQLEIETQIRGVVCIMDFDGLSMKQVKALSPSFSKRLLTFIQDAMPLRMREIHFVKQPWLFKMVWQLFKPFVREKLNKRMHFHGNDMKSLHKFLSPEILPENYKGQLPKIDYGGKEWLPALEKHADFVKDWSEMGPAQW